MHVLFKHIPEARHEVRGVLVELLAGALNYALPPGGKPGATTLNPTPYTLNPTPSTIHPKPYTLNPTPYTINPITYTLHPKP